MPEWNGETIATLRNLWLEGLSIRDIEKRTGWSKNSIVGMAHRLDLPARPSPIKRGEPGAEPKPSPPKRAGKSTLPPLPPLPPAPPSPAPLPPPVHHPPHPHPTTPWRPRCAGAAASRNVAGRSESLAAADSATATRRLSRVEPTAASTSTCRACPARRWSARSCRCARCRLTPVSTAWSCRQPPGCRDWWPRSTSTDAPRGWSPSRYARRDPDGRRAEAPGARSALARPAVPILRHRHVVAEQGCRARQLARGNARPHRAAVLGRQPRSREPAAVLQAVQRRARGDGRLPGGFGMRAGRHRPQATRRGRGNLVRVDRTTHQASKAGCASPREEETPARSRARSQNVSHTIQRGFAE